MFTTVVFFFPALRKEIDRSRPKAVAMVVTSLPEAASGLRLPELHEKEAEGGALRNVSWEEVRKHNTRESAWLVIADRVYDITRWGPRHPGGKVIYHYAGQDATDCFREFHPDAALVAKYLKPLLIGALETETRPVPSPFVQEFRQLREEFQARGLFRTNWLFFFGMLAHILLLEAAAYACLRTFGTGWPAYLLAVGLLATAQAQAGWLQVRDTPPTT